MMDIDYRIGDHVSGYDPAYDCALAGTIDEVAEGRYGVTEVLFVNEIPGPFEGKRVALSDEMIKAHYVN